MQNTLNPRQRLQELLIQLSYEKKDVILSSGKPSNFYFDGKQTALHPEGALLLGRQLWELLRQKFPEMQAVGGPTLGADPLVTSVSLVSQMEGQPIPAFIIRKEPKKHGTQNWIEGEKNLKPGMVAVIVEDVVTTGASSLKAVEKARDAGLRVAGILAIIDREEGGRETIEKAGLKLVTLFTKSELLT